MSMAPATRIELKKDISRQDAQQTVQQIHNITGQFNIMSNANPVVLVVNTTNPEKIARIRQLPNVAKVGHQL